MKSIRVFFTHIEVYPYMAGEDIQLERSLSSFDPKTRIYTPLAYHIEEEILYLPRGVNLSYLVNKYHVTPTIETKPDRPKKMSEKVTMLMPPKNNIQKDAIKFLLSKREFAKDAALSQLGLTLDTGDGKTYCMVSAITSLNLKTAIFTYTKRIKNQWIETFHNMTDMDHHNLVDITGTEMIEKIYDKKIVADVYMITHQSLNAYARKHGWQKVHELFKIMGIGIKVIDESHYFFENSLHLDFFTNVKKSYYLTATFTRNSAKERYVFKRAYASVKTFGEETYTYKEKRKHIICTIVYFKSPPSIRSRHRVRTYRGFSTYKYITYELDEEEGVLLDVIAYILDLTKNLRGKTLITSPKIESVEIIAEKMRERTDKKIGTMHCRNKDAKNEDNKKECDIISSTVKSTGTGADIKGLRVLINTEPIGSSTLMDQLRGRLREFSPTDDTYLFYLVDTSVKEARDMVKRFMPMLKYKCKQVMERYIELDDIKPQ